MNAFRPQSRDGLCVLNIYAFLKNKMLQLLDLSETEVGFPKLLVEPHVAVQIYKRGHPLLSGLFLDKFLLYSTYILF